MAKVKADKFIELLERSGLIDDDRSRDLVKKGLAQLKQEYSGKLPNDSEKIADKLVEVEAISRWQANNLLSGKHKGFLLGKYKLIRHLGTGGMSSVYLGENTRMRNRVAIKVLPRSKVEDSSYLARFQLEARAAASVNHPNIMRAIDIDSDGNVHYFVMEYVEGVDLQGLVKKDGPLPFEKAADYVAQAALGLQHAHDGGLIHRDIKPANLLLDTKGVVKILDMGLARFTDDDAPSLTIAHDENVLGTADYLSPEQAINSHGVDYRADIYSLGCTLYFLLTGHAPFCEGTLPQRLMKHQTEQPPSIYDDRPDAPAGLVDICMRMMVKSPDGRYQSAQAVYEDLLAWAKNPSLVGVSSGESYSPSSQTGRVEGVGTRKELRTRKSDSATSSPTGDTNASAESDTYKSPGRPTTRRPGDSGPGRNRSGSGDSGKNRGLTRSPDSRSAGANQRASDSGGEFVFDEGGKPSILQERKERKRKRSTGYLVWIFLVAGIGLACYLGWKLFG